MEEIIVLKERIHKNYRKIQRKYPITKIILKEIDKFIENNTSPHKIHEWQQKHDNSIFALKYNLEQIEKATLTR